MAPKKDMITNHVDISIIIVHYKNIQDTLNCLYSIQRSEPALNYEIIVIDNYPQSDDGAAIKEKFPSVRYMKMSYNMGFGRANNIGAQHALSDFLLFLNNDIEIKKQAVSISLAKYKSLTNVGLITSRIIGKDGGGIQYSAFLQFASLRKYIQANFLAILLRRIRKKNNISLQNKTELDSINSKSGYVPWVTGAFMLCAKNIFDLAKGFDDDYFMYSEDVDLCFRLNKLGYKHYLSIDSEVIHGIGKSFNIDSYRVKQIIASKWLFLRKNRGTFYFVLAFLILKINFFSDAFIAFIRRKKLPINQKVQNNLINHYFLSIVFYNFRRNTQYKYFKVY